VIRPFLRKIKKLLSYATTAIVRCGIAVRHFFKAFAVLVKVVFTGQAKSEYPFKTKTNSSNGIRSYVPTFTALVWNLFHHKNTVLVLFSTQHHENSRENELSIRQLASILSATVLEITEEKGLTEIRNSLLQVFPRHDAIFLDRNEKSPTAVDVVRLKYAAYRYQKNDELGAVLPLLVDAEGNPSTFDLDIVHNKPVQLLKTQDLYGQTEIPRMTRVGYGHGFFATATFLSKTEAPIDLLTPTAFSAWILKGWEYGRKSLILSPVKTSVKKLPEYVDWKQNIPAFQRKVGNPGANPRVIFILPATSISGGIRTVFEQADGLTSFGFDTEIWALQGQPDWFDLKTPVKQFKTYADMIDALRFEDAFKVATWWETAEVVWQGSINRGIPIFFVQEFESWFYPNNDSARAAVANTYRHEMNILTIADYTLNELSEIGVPAEKIPVAYNSDTFFIDETIEREPQTVMAVGRSFFQKNFVMTLNAWKQLPKPRPKFLLFGIEPNVAPFPEVHYVFRPSDDRVRELYNSATCFVQTSFHEGFCLPVLEAMASGCPVITTDSHGNRDFCFDGYNCLIVEQGNEQQLSETIQKLLSDKVLQETLRKGGLETAEKYRWDVVLQQTTDYLNKLENMFKSPQRHSS